MSTALGWVTVRDGVESLVLYGLAPGVLAELGRLPQEQLAGELPVFPTETLRGGEPPPLRQPMAGHYDVTSNEVRFTPRFPFLAGTSYSMVVPDRAPLEIQRSGAAGTPSTTVRAVWPTGEVIPRNALRFYVHFSAPMSDGLAARHVHLEHADTGQRLEGALFPMDPELWDPQRRRLTVLLDPGRIKQGLAAHREIGYPLEIGSPVVLVVEESMRDATNQPLAAEHRQRYEVGPDSRARVFPGRWHIGTPSAASRGALRVTFDRPLDRALLERCLLVIGTDGREIRGIPHVGDGDRSWAFEPEDAWGSGEHRLLVDRALEDVAGNSVVRVFDRDLARSDHVPGESADVAVSFVIGSTPAGVRSRARG